MQVKTLTAFKQHDLDRDRLLTAIEELKVAFTFNSPCIRVSDNFSNLCIRLGYVLTDTIAMTQVLLEVDDTVRSIAEQLEDVKVPAEVRIKRFISAASYEIPAIDRLAVVYKALFFSLRAFQDIEYATLLELIGQKAGSSTSMSKCFKSKGNTPSNNPIYSLITTDIPTYEKWFNRFRNIRNDLKTGRGHGLATSNGRIQISISLQQGNVSATAATIGLPDVTEAIEMSAALFQLMKNRCQLVGRAERSETRR